MKSEELASTIYVGGVPEEITSLDLRNIFITFGEIKAVQIPVDLNTARPRGYAFIEYDDPEDAESAIDNFDETELFGRVVKVKPAKPYKNPQFENKAVWHTEEWQKEQHFNEKKKEQEREAKQGRRGRKDGKKDGKKHGKRPFIKK